MVYRNGQGILMPQTLLKNSYLIIRMVGYDDRGVTYLGVDNATWREYIIYEFAPWEISNRCADGSIDVNQDSYELYVYMKKCFMDEVVTVASIDDTTVTDGIVGIVDYFEANNTAYVVMEKPTEMTLGERVRNMSNIIEPAEIVNNLNNVARAIASLNTRGFFPTTIHPDAILKGIEGCRLLCWGNLRVLNYSSENEEMIAMSFKAPENRKDMAVGTPEGCVYSLAAVLYYCMSGLCNPEPVSESKKKSYISMRGTVNSVTNLVVKKALRQNPEKRYKDIASFWINLSSAIYQGTAEDYDDEEPDNWKRGFIGFKKKHNLQSHSEGKKGNRIRCIAAAGVLILFIVSGLSVVRWLSESSNNKAGSDNLTESSQVQAAGQNDISGTFLLISAEDEALALCTTETAVNHSKLTLTQANIDIPEQGMLYDIFKVTEGDKSGYVLRCHNEDSEDRLTSADYVLSVKDKSREDGAALCQREYRIGEDQFWNIVDCSDGKLFYIESIYGTAIDGADYELAGVRLRHYKGNISQQWKLIKIAD